MNILPLVFSILIIFSLLCFGFLREVKSHQVIETSLEGYMHAQKIIYNALVKKTYEKIKGDTTQIQEPKKCKVRSQTYSSRREHQPPLETSKFYLRALCNSSDEISRHPLYQPLARLLTLLYEKKVFSKHPKKDKCVYALIEALVKKAKATPSARNLSDLYPDDPDLQEIYYKMLKGTNRYNRDTGIPPLAHFLSLDKADKAIHLSLSSPLVLEGVFSSPICGAILEREKQEWETTQKYYAFSKQDFQELITKDPVKSSELLPLEPFLSYSKQVSKQKKFIKRDKRTGIGIEKEL